MDTNEKDEMIEEINEDLNPTPENQMIEEIVPDRKIEVTEDNVNQAEPTLVNEASDVINEEPVATEVEVNEQPNEALEVESDINNNDSEEKVYETVEQPLNEKPKKSKVPLIVLLSILLVIDVAALVIYIIGIDKVLSFIK